MAGTIRERLTQMPILTLLKVLVVLSPGLVYGVQELRMKWQDHAFEGKLAAAVEAAKREERGVQTQLCQGRISAMEATIAGNAFTTVNIVQEAQRKTPAAPTDKAALQVMCDADPMCRDRRKK